MLRCKRRPRAQLVAFLLAPRALPRGRHSGRTVWAHGAMRSMLAARRALCTAAAPPAPKPPAFTPAQTILQSIQTLLPRIVTTGVVTHGEPIVYVEPKDVPIMLRFLRDHTGTRCKQLLDITAVDVPTREKRFEVSSPPSPLPALPDLPLHPVGRAPRPAHRLARTAHRTSPTPAPAPLAQVAYQLLSHDHNRQRQRGQRVRRAAADAATHRSGSPPACLGLPRAREERPRRLAAAEELQRGRGGGVAPACLPSRRPCRLLAAPAGSASRP